MPGHHIMSQKLSTCHSERHAPITTPLAKSPTSFLSGWGCRSWLSPDIPGDKTLSTEQTTRPRAWATKALGRVSFPSRAGHFSRTSARLQLPASKRGRRLVIAGRLVVVGGLFLGAILGATLNVGTKRPNQRVLSRSGQFHHARDRRRTGLLQLALFRPVSVYRLYLRQCSHRSRRDRSSVARCRQEILT